MDAVVIADSQNTATGHRLVTVLLPRFPYTLLQEVATHRLLSQVGGETRLFGSELSRNGASTRAIPVERLIEAAERDPFQPHFTMNQRGMVGAEGVPPEVEAEARAVWAEAQAAMLGYARRLAALGIHKQHVNDLLKPFARLPVLVTATDWENFLRLRTHPTCRPEFRSIALEIQAALASSQPTPKEPGQMHLPFGDRMEPDWSLEDKVKVAVARCARVSYAAHDGSHSLESHLRLYEELQRHGHLSPFEHVAVAVDEVHPAGLNLPQARVFGGIAANTRNLRGWYALRAAVEDGIPVSAFWQ